MATSLVFLSENGLPADERLDANAWEALTMDIAASRVDREQRNRALARADHQVRKDIA